MLATEKRIGTIEWEARDTTTPVIAGYAAIFGSETVIAGLFREQVAPGAFDAALVRDDVRALFNHDPNALLARTSSGDLRLSVDARGLKYEIDVDPDDPEAMRVYRLVQKRKVSQSSFAFTVTGQEWKDPTRTGELPLRIIRDVQLFDVSPVTYPAYDETSVAARDAAAALVRATAETPAVDLTARWRVRIAERV